MAVRCGLAAAGLAGLLAGACHAQVAPDGLRLTTLDPPRNEEVVQRYRAATGVAHAVAYATEIDGGRLTPDARPPRAIVTPPIGAPVLDGNLGLLVVVGVLGAALVLWLRFGGAGVLGAGPRDVPARPVAPDGWAPSPSGDPASGDVLAAIAAMPDRRAALVRLARLCLMHAAEVSGTRLARSDTERSALRRLPPDWRGTGPLPDLLRRTELAHYGGQDVPEDRFAESLAAARSILGRTGGAHA